MLCTTIPKLLLLNAARITPFLSYMDKTPKVLKCSPRRTSLPETHAGGGKVLKS